VREGEKLSVIGHLLGHRRQKHSRCGRICHPVRLLRTRWSPRPLTANPGRALTRVTA
jgi:hypothetical protein